LLALSSGQGGWGRYAKYIQGWEKRCFIISGMKHSESQAWLQQMESLRVWAATLVREQRMRWKSKRCCAREADEIFSDGLSGMGAPVHAWFWDGTDQELLSMRNAAHLDFFVFSSTEKVVKVIGSRRRGRGCYTSNFRGCATRSLN
jgi:hypothetical protein